MVFYCNELIQQGVTDSGREFIQPLSNPRQGQGFAGVVGRLQHGKPAGEKERFVHIQSGNQLPGYDIAPGVAGYHDGEKRLVVKACLAKQGGKTVDEGGQIGGQRVIVIGTEHHYSGTPANGGVDLILHHAAVEAAPSFAKVETHGVGTARAVRQGAVAQPDFGHSERVAKAGSDFLPQRQGVGGVMAGGVEHQKLRLLRLGEDFPLQSIGQFPGGCAVGSQKISIQLPGLNLKVDEGTGTLYQWAAQKRTAGQIGC